MLLANPWRFVYQAAIRSVLSTGFWGTALPVARHISFNAQGLTEWQRQTKRSQQAAHMMQRTTANRAAAIF